MADNESDNDEKVCTHADGCEMYELFKHAGTLFVWKNNYCNSEYERCARFKMSSEGKPVPKYLLPNGSSLGTK